ncbi:MAG TPA: transposase, partial [Pirellulales bacterium]
MIVSKAADHLPLYRQERINQRQGVFFPRSTTCDWWLHRGDERHPFSVFDFSPDQSRDGPDKFLKNYSGCLQCDAAGVYDSFFVGSRMTGAGCWAHARRRFHEARQLDPRIGQTALAYIAQLYAVERELRARRGTEWQALDLDELALRVATVRQERSRPVLTNLRTWLDVEWPQLLP